MITTRSLPLLVFCVLLFLQLPAQNWIQEWEKGKSFEEVKASFDAEWRGKEYTRSKGYKQYYRFEYFFEPRIFPDNKWPDPMQVWKERQAVQKLSVPESTTNQWNPLGPSDWVDGSGWNAGVGRINVVRVDPNSSNTIYVGAPAGGLWKSSDSGLTWSCLTDNQAVLGVSDICIDPNNSNTIYIATGDGDGADTYSVGVLKSTDGGQTWQTTGLNFQVTQSRRIRRLLIDPSNSNILYAAATNGLYKTVNAGSSWSSISSLGFQDLAFKPGNSSIVYAVNDAFYKSTDSGQSFNQISNGLPNASTVNRYKIGVSPDAPSWVYLVGGKEVDSTFKGLYLSTNSGASFSLQSDSPNIFGYSTSGNDDAGQSGYDLAISVDPSDASTLYVGAINVWKSDDAGLSLEAKTYWVYPNNTGYTHADIHFLGHQNGILYCGSDGGVFQSTDQADNWTDLTSGLQMTQFYDIALSASNASLIIGGTQDNGTNIYSGSTTWEHVIGADGMECIIDPSNSNTMYGSVQFGSIRKSTNGGNSFSEIIDPDDFNENASWVTPYKLDPNNPNTIFVGYKEVYKSTNGGNSFSQVSNMNSSLRLRELEIAPSNSNRIYVSREDELLRSSNGGSTFTDISSGLPNRWITRIMIDPVDEDRLWVSFSGYTSNEKVYFSADGGNSWSNLSGGLPNLPANCLTYRPGSNDEIYLGMDVGVYKMEANSNNWTLVPGMLPNVIVEDLEIHDATDQLFAGTYGRGLWVYNLPQLLDPCNPDVTDPIASCQNILIDLAGGLVTISASQIDDNSTDNCNVASLALSQTQFDCDDFGTTLVTLTVTDDAGNTDQCVATVTAEDSTPLVATCANRVFQLDPNGQLIIDPSLLDGGSTAGCNPLQFDPSLLSFDCNNLGDNQIVLTVNTASGQMDSCESTVTIQDVQSPFTFCTSTSLTIDASGTATLDPADIDGGTFDNCSFTLSASQTEFDCDDVGSGLPVILTATDDSGNFGTCTTFVTISDTEPPVAVCQDVIANLDANGGYILDPQLADGGSSDNCQVFSTAASQTVFTCDDLSDSPLNLTLTVNDFNNGTDQCTFTLTLTDSNPPQLTCQDNDVVLDASGTTVIDPALFVSTSNTSCGSAQLSADPATFECSAVGVPQMLTITATSSGGQSSCDVTINVLDTTSPQLSCINVTKTLDSSGQTTVSASDFISSQSDNCAIDQASVSQTNFDCSNIGQNTITVTVTDIHGNASNCDVELTVADFETPVLTCQDAILTIDQSTSVTLDYAQVLVSESDNCSIILHELSQTTFSCSDVGTNPQVTLTITDQGGNTNDCTVNVTLINEATPIANCVADLTVELDQDGTYILDPVTLDNGSSLICGSILFEATPSSLSCDNIGQQSATLTVINAANNASSSCDVTILVQDNQAPQLVCNSIEAYLEADGDVLLSNTDFDIQIEDNCSDANFVASNYLFDCDDLGTSIVTINAVDNNSNISTCEVSVAVIDTISPNAICSDFEASLDESGDLTVEAVNFDGGSSDACGQLVFNTTDLFFSCDDLGSNPVELTVIDGSGNTSTCAASLTVLDQTAPQAQCQDIELFISLNNEVELEPSLLNGGSTDNCGDLIFSADQTTFTCDQIGNQTVILTVSDQSGNSDTCQSMVSIQDNSTPVASCVDTVFVFLDDLGQALINAADVDAGSSFACDIQSISIDNDAYSCEEVNQANLEVNLLLVDGNGTQSGCSSIVVVSDTIGPNVNCVPFLTYSLNSTGVVEVPYSDMDAGSSDACTEIFYAQESVTFDCDDVGVINYEVIIFDDNSNFNSCFTQLSIEDNNAPEANCKDITIILDEQGTYQIQPSEIDDGSFDSCSDALVFEVNPFLLDCDDVGTVQVELTVNDIIGNVTSTCISNVEVIDNTPPVLDISNSIDFTIMMQDTVLEASWFDLATQDLCCESFFTIKRLNGNCNYIDEFTSFVPFCGEENSGQYTLLLHVEDCNGNFVEQTVFVNLINQTTSTADIDTEDYVLFQNTPNPFVETTTIDFYIPRRDRVQIEVYDLKGQRLFRQDDTYYPGRHSLFLSSQGWSAGVYVVEMKARDFIGRKKIIKID